jgi:STE24 endopeptidase
MAFDPQAATAQPSTVTGADALAKAAAYYTRRSRAWLLLWGPPGVGARHLADRALGRAEPGERKSATAQLNLRAFIEGVTCFFVAMTLLTLPWTLCHKAGGARRAMASRALPMTNFLIRQGSIAMLLSAVLGALFMVGVYAPDPSRGSCMVDLVRRPRGGFASAGLLLAAPILRRCRSSIRSSRCPRAGARRAGGHGAAGRKYRQDHIVFDGSRQSSNFTANAAGLAGSARIAISDVAFKGASLDEVKAVTGLRSATTCWATFGGRLA